MDVRKWTERQTDKVWESCQHSDRDICPACVADAFAPTITKLVEALQFVISITDEELQYAKVGTGAEVALRHANRKATEALTELEKP